MRRTPINVWAREATQHGVMFTDARLARHDADIRNRALEEAAKVAESFVPKMDMHELQPYIAAAIRALKDGA